jgi:transcriptional regulator with XRE-family HTH domain
MKLANNIATICKKKGWPIARLARETGVPVKTIHGWTAGKKALNIDDVRKVAEGLEISLHQLLFGTPDPYEGKDLEILEQIFSGDVRVTIHKIKHRKEIR